MSKKHKIILIGPYPPLVGGVSTHLFRALPLLLKSGFKAVVISVNKTDTKNPNVSYIPSLLLPFYLFLQPKSIVHFHVDSLSHLLVSVILRLRHKTFLTVHNNRYPTTMESNSIGTWLKWKCLSTFTRIICVNSVTQTYLKNRLSNVFKDVIPAFLPPADIDEDSINEIKKWGRKFDYVLSGYAYRLSFYKDEDLYGVDMMIDLVSRLKTEKINVGLVLLINLEENAYLEKLKRDIIRLKLQDDIHLIDINQGVDAVALWKYSDVYLRPTNTDGNSISVMEALHMGTTVVASDCVERPEGCLLFKTRDGDDFVRVVGSGVSKSFNFKSATNTKTQFLYFYDDIANLKPTYRT